jgi:lambda family phage portal protein
MSLGTFIDSLIYQFSPERGAQRMAARRLVSTALESERRFKALYEGANDDRLVGEKWMASQLSTDSGLESDLKTLRRNSRTLYRDDFLGGAVDSRVNHTVGNGFTVQSLVAEIDGLITADESATINKQLERLWMRVQGQLCLTRKHSIWDKTNLVRRCLDVDGEAFVVMSDVASDTRIPLALQVIDAERVETPPNKIGDKLCRMGVQKNASGRIVGYWIRTSHPHDTVEFTTTYDYVPAARVCHVFVEWFAGQSRGLPWMTRSLKRARYGADLDEAGLVATQIQTCWAAFVKQKGSPIRSAIGAASRTNTNLEREQKVKPGTINYIGGDDEVTFSNPTASNMVGTLTEHNDRAVAAGLNWPYELTMGDWRGCSFAGGRIVLNSAKLDTKKAQKLIADAFLTPVWEAFVDRAVSLGLVEIDPMRYQRDRWVFTQHSWTAPKWSYSLTPGEEVSAKVMAIDNNLETLADVLAEDQYDLEEVLAQRQKERATEREFNILPTKVTQVERPQGNPESAMNGAAV